MKITELTNSGTHVFGAQTIEMSEITRSHEKPITCL